MSAGSIEAVDGVTTTWGESLRWDDRRERLYFVDCATATLHWLDHGEPPIHGMHLPSTPTGVVLTEGSALVICLDDGLHVVDPDAGTVDLLTPYPTGLHGRANDATADMDGALVTGTLNLEPGPGALWRFSVTDGWTLLVDGFGNTNGPVVLHQPRRSVLVVADTLAGAVYEYDYGRPPLDARRVLCDHGVWGGTPDGATADAEDRVWSCVLRAGAVARLDRDGDHGLVDLPAVNPSDVTFGGTDLRTMFVTTIGLDLGGGVGAADGHLLRLDGDTEGRPEPRFALGSGRSAATAPPPNPQGGRP